MTNRKNDEKLKETDRPWERPGQLAQNPSEKAPTKEDRQGTFEQVNKTS
jgi:hypothetical protein